MHQQQKQFCESVKNRFPERFDGVSVIDFGSLDINGNNKYLFTNSNYTGVDIGKGNNVDVVSRAKDYKPKEKVDVVISTEMLEHDEQWEDSLRNMLHVIRSNGLIVFTCAAPGRPEHGTRRTTPGDAPFVGDYYRNLNEDDIRSVWDMSVFKEYHLQKAGNDLQFWGIVK